MSDLVLIIATVMSAIAAAMSFLSVYLHNRPIVVVSLAQEGEAYSPEGVQYRLVATNLSTTAAARDIRVSVKSMPEAYSEIWTQAGVAPDSEWNIRFLAPGETVPLNHARPRVMGAWLKEMASEPFRRKYQAEVIIDVRPSGQIARFNPFARTISPISFKQPRVEDLRLARGTRKARERDRMVGTNGMEKILRAPEDIPASATHPDVLERDQGPV